MKSRIERFKESYNKYVNHYNISNGVRAYNELLTIKTELNQRTEAIKEQVGSIIANLNANLNRISLAAEVCKDEQRAKVLESFFERGLNNYTNTLSTLATAVPDKNLEILCRAINEFYEIHNVKNAGESVVLAKDMFKVKENYQRVYLHFIAIRSLTDKILREDYPEKELKRYEKLPEDEQEAIKAPNYRGELTEECIETLEKYAKKSPKIGTKKFFKAAHTQFESCRKTDTDESISWSTLRNRVKEKRPDIYNKVATR